MKTRSLVLLVLALLAPLTAAAQQTRMVVQNLDPDSATPTFCLLEALENQGPARIQTSGSSTTVTAVSGSPFSVAAVGTRLTARTGLGTFVRTIMAKASDTSVTVDSAVDLTGGAAWTYQNVTCGTTGEIGWLDVAAVTPLRTWALTVGQISLASGNLAAVLWCRQYVGQDPTQVYPESGASGGACVTGLFTTTATCGIVDNYIHFNQCRWSFTLTDDGGDTGANQEKVSISVMGAR